MFALILLVLTTISALAWPLYYLRVAKPWRNPIGRLMLAQAGAVLLYVSRSWVSYVLTHRALSDYSTFGMVSSIVIVVLLASFIPVYEYVRRKARREHDRT